MACLPNSIENIPNKISLQSSGDLTQMENVVLVTWKGSGNFGTCLQSFALYRKIENMGFHVSFLPGIPQQYTWRTRLKGLLSVLGLLDKTRKFRKSKESLQDIKRKKFQEGVFKDVELFSKKDERLFLNRTDCFIAGSDQIWNTHYSFSPFYFLSFAKDKKRIAYASSIGTGSIKEEYKDAVCSLLNKFSYIGVRENKAVKILSELTGRSDIQQVLDPTFLLSPAEWFEMSKTAVIECKIPKRYILCYLIGNNSWYESQLQDVRQKVGIDDILIIPAVENLSFSVKGATIYRDASPVEFVFLLQKAAYVCTDSFHATALSINHSIPFVEFIRFRDNEEVSQNSRIYDVLSHYHLTDRIYNEGSGSWLSEIDFQTVQEILMSDRKSSIDYLVNAIKN